MPYILVNLQILTHNILSICHMSSYLPRFQSSKKPQMTILGFLALCVFCLLSFLLFSTTGFCTCLLMHIIQSPNFSLSYCQPIIFITLFHGVFQCPDFCVSLYVFSQSQLLPQSHFLSLFPIPITSDFLS